MMKIKAKLARFVLGVAMVPLASAAFAAGACYTPAQMRAEQLLRLHSELMVITAICRQDSSGAPLPNAYSAFTRKNIRVLHDAEQTMTAYYKETAKGDPVSRLDHLRMLLANEYGQKSASMTSPRFCATYRDLVLRFNAASPQEIEAEAARLELTSRAYAPRCMAMPPAPKRRQ